MIRPVADDSVLSWPVSVLILIDVIASRCVSILIKHNGGLGASCPKRYSKIVIICDYFSIVCHTESDAHGYVISRGREESVNTSDTAWDMKASGLSRKQNMNNVPDSFNQQGE